MSARNPIEQLGLQALEEIGESPVIWAPQDGPQQLAYYCEAEQVGYGGAAGGGKTDLGLAKARLRHRNSLLLRRTYPELEDHMINRSKIFYGPLKHYNGSRRVWTFPNEDRRITFRSLDHVNDLMKLERGSEYDFIHLDEATTFWKEVPEYLLSRLRTIHRGQYQQMLLTTNPGGEGHLWFFEMFKPWLDPSYENPADPGEIRYFAKNADGEEMEVERDWRGIDRDGYEIQPISRTYFPARLSDNKYYDEEYRRKLQNMPEPRRSMMLFGDWLTHDNDAEWQVILSEWVGIAENRQPLGGPLLAVAIDPGRSTSATAQHGGETAFAFLYGDWEKQRLTGYTYAIPSSQTPSGKAGVESLLRVAAQEGHPDVGNVLWICDEPGVGGAFIDAARELDFQCEPFRGQASTGERTADGGMTFKNDRARVYWRLREALNPQGGWKMSLPQRDSRLNADLRAVQYLDRSYIQLEQKELVKARLGRSPDRGDALSMTMFRPKMFFDREKLTVSLRSAPDSDAEPEEIVVGACGGRVNGLCGVIGKIYRGEVRVTGEFWIMGSRERQADQFAGELFERGVGGESQIFIGPMKEGGLDVYAYEFERVGLTLCAGYPEDLGLAAIEVLLEKDQLVVDPSQAPKLADAMKEFREIADQKALDAMGDKGKLNWQGPRIYVRALCDVAAFARGVIEDQGLDERELTPLERRREARKRMEPEPAEIGMGVFNNVDVDMGDYDDEE